MIVGLLVLRGWEEVIKEIEGVVTVGGGRESVGFWRRAERVDFRGAFCCLFVFRDSYIFSESFICVLFSV